MGSIGQKQARRSPVRRRLASLKRQVAGLERGCGGKRLKVNFCDGLAWASSAPVGWRTGCCACDGNKRERIAVDPSRQIFGVHCHCRKCQRYHGAPFTSVLGFAKTDGVLLLGPGTGIAQTEDGYRVFCSVCMTPVLNNGQGYVGTFPSLFISADESTPLPTWRWDRHEFVSFGSLPLAHVPADSLPRLADCPVQFGGTGRIAS